MSLYGLIIGIAILVGFQYFVRHNILVPQKLENRFITLGVIVAIIGARLYHVLDSWDYYSQHLLQILNTRAGGLGIYGALIFGLIYIYTFSRIHRLNSLEILDALAPILPLCQAFGRLGNFFNQEIPFWWFESILNLFLFSYLHLSPRKAFAKYLIGYGLIRFIFEFFRTDTWIFGHIKIAQIISIIFIVTGLFLITHGQSQITQNHNQKHPLVS